MFGLGRTKVLLNDFASLMAQVALLPLENPSEQDLAFLKQPVGAGVGREMFAIEVIALQIYVMGAVINRERLEGRMRLEVAEPLVNEYLRAIHGRLQPLTNAGSLLAGSGIDQVMEFVSKRGEAYSQPSWGHGSYKNIPLFFAKFCGVPESDVLQRIGWSLTVVRGDSHGDWLLTLKIV